MGRFDGPILTLDLAERSGWAFGTPGERPQSGSVRFASNGRSTAAHFRECRTWLIDFVAVNHPAIVVIEAPLPPSFMAGKTNTDTVRMLMGLIAVVEEALYDTNVRVREARVSKVREYFLGTNRNKRETAKELTKQRCHALGWAPQDDNAADALALWAYMVSIIAPAEAIKFEPLFMRRAIG